MNLIDRFLKYVSFDTQSDYESTNTPSTDKQFLLADYLKNELLELGLCDVERDEYGFVYATIPSNTEKKNVPTIGFIAHLDTSPDCVGSNIKPRIIHNYDGKDIVLSEGVVSTTDMFPELLNHIGEDLVVTDGTTLLGADDKAGIAEIVSACDFLLKHPEIKHGTVKIAFTPDEEIGLGVKKFDINKFNADFAYTFDGSELGELEFENFNAASAKILIKGLSVHPGYAKNKMINAAMVAMEFANFLPREQTPEYTDGYEGFFHLLSVSAGCEEAVLNYIIRDHDRELFEYRKKVIQDTVNIINKKYGNIATVDIVDQYYNMKEFVPDYVVNYALEAIKLADVNPVVKPIRGGTDGAQLSVRGLPCPNIFAGGVNFHGPYEFCSLQTMEKAMQTIINICTIVENNN